MLAAERKQQIKEIVIAKKSASVAALAKQFGVTGETIRRDLKALEKEGVLMRTHGGAFIQSGVENLIDIDLRKTVYIDEKELIAKRCYNLVNNGDAIFLDNSTTCYHVAKALSDLNITVVTNNLMIMNLFAQSENIRLVSVGGEFSIKEQAFSGTIAQRALAEYYVDKAFISCRTVSINNGITESTDQWASIRHLMIERSDKQYLVVDHTKFGQTSFVRICDFDEITAVITDHPLDAKWHEALRSKGCSVIDSDDETSVPEANNQPPYLRPFSAANIFNTTICDVEYVCSSLFFAHLAFIDCINPLQPPSTYRR